MNILHVYKDYHPILGGIENHIKDLAEAQAAAGHRVTVLATDPGGRSGHSVENGVQVIRVRRIATIASTPLSPSFPLALGRLSPEITHLHFPYPVGEISQLMAGGHRPFVITYHSDVINPRQQLILRFYRPLLQIVLRRARGILATSPNYVQTSPVLRPLAEKCAVVPLGVDPGPFLSARPVIRATAEPTLLFVGRHRYYKGVDVLLRALSGLDARLLVGGDGPMRPAWEATARELDVGAKVRFLGDIAEADLPGLYASADLFVLPATMRAEAFGMVLLEAMAAGLPCVTTELGTGTSFVVQDGETGFVVPPGEPAALAAALHRLLDSTDLRAQMGAAGRARLLDAFTLDRMTARVETAYRDFLSDGARAEERARDGSG